MTSTGPDGSTIHRTVARIGGGGPRITLAATDGDIAIRRAPPLRR